MADTLTNAAPQTSGEDGITAQGAAEGTPTAGATAGATNPANPTSAVETRTFTQADVDQIVKARLAEHTKRSEAQIKAAADKAEADKLAAQGEFKTLAEQRAARIAELEPLQERVTAYEATISGLLKAKLDSLTAEAKRAVEALPGNPSPLDRLNWLEQNAALFTRTPAPNVNATDGRGGGAPSPTQDASLAAVYGVRPEFWGK